MTVAMWANVLGIEGPGEGLGHEGEFFDGTGRELLLLEEGTCRAEDTGASSSSSPMS